MAIEERWGTNETDMASQRRVKINCEECDMVLAGDYVSMVYSLVVGPKGLALVRFHVIQKE